MTILERYVSRSVLSAIGLVVLALLGLYMFILFVEQLNDLGRGQYTVWSALWVVFLKLPLQLYQFFPIAALLGCLIGLGTLANHRELLVMQSAGMSIPTISVSILKVAFFLILGVTFLGEYYAPKGLALAKNIKLQAITGGNVLRVPTGLWLRYQDDFLHIGQAVSSTLLQDVVEFHFDDLDRLRFSRHIERLEKHQGHWDAFHVQETQFLSHRTVVHQWKHKRWDIPLDERMVSIMHDSMDESTVLELYQRIHLAQALKQSTSALRFAFWKRIVQPFNTLLMIALGIPFIFGPLRQSTMGSKLLIGISVGFGFHLINHFFSPMVQVFNWSPEVVAWLPFVIFSMGIAIFFIRKKV